MKLAEIRTLFDYDAWATERILTQAAKLTPEQFATNPGASKSSVRQLLAHTLIAQLLWRTRFETGTSNIDTKADDALTAGTLRQWWAEERQAMRAHLDTLTDDDLDRPFRFERRGEATELTRWQILFQLINHGTQHRSEVAAILTDYGHSPGDLDFFFFVLSSR